MNFDTNLNQKTARERASSVCLAEGQILMVKLKDPVSGVERLFPPGGKIEPGESPDQTAVRETREETGFEVEPLPNAKPIVVTYPFDWASVVYEVHTHFVACRLSEAYRAPRAIADESYNLGAVWLPVAEVSAALAFQDDIRKAVLACLRFF